ncbi:FACT complex subunit SSRP1-like [Sycon ciliatum]|uniref:FACT complex subunit SSRP1-like n=1 Tax=Sycon ciliatum TaxID=27933 RepID=UPI0031F6E078
MQPEKITFKASRSGKIEQFSPDGLESVNWTRAPKGWELSLVAKSGSCTRLQGFKETESQRLQGKISKWYKLPWSEVERSVRGLSYGKTDFCGSSLKFVIDDKPSFELPLESVCQTSITKNEVHLEFHPNDEADVQLSEMRFYVPPSLTSAVGDGIADDKDAAKEFHTKITSHADILRVSGDALITFDEMSCLVPRGRYTVKVYPGFLFLHGKSYDFTVPFQSIVRLFLLPHNDMRQMYFVVAMDPPMRQGQTRYPFLILILNKEESMEAEVALSEEELEKQYQGKLTQQMNGPIYEVLSRVMKAVASKKIVVPGNYRSQRGGQCISCSYKANHGMLFPLEKGFIFVHKPALHVRFDEVVAVNFSRGGTGTHRSFDFELEVKNNIVHIFQSMDKDEYSRLYDFCSAKKLRIRNKGGKSGSATYRDDFDDDDSDQDAYLGKVKAEGASRMDDTDSDDSSYVAGGSGEDSAGDLEFDSDAVLSSDEENAAKTVPAVDESKKRKKAPSKPKQPKEKVEKAEKKEKKEPKEKKERKEKKEKPSASSTSVAKAKKKEAPISKEEISDSDSGGSDVVMEDESDDDGAPPAKRSTRSRRGQSNDEELAQLPSEGSNDEEEAELTSGASDVGSDDGDESD